MSGCVCVYMCVPDCVFVCGRETPCPVLCVSMCVIMWVTVCPHEGSVLVRTCVCCLPPPALLLVYLESLIKKKKNRGQVPRVQQPHPGSGGGARRRRGPWRSRGEGAGPHQLGGPRVVTGARFFLWGGLLPYFPLPWLPFPPSPQSKRLPESERI